MNLSDLADHMGSAADHEDARIMRELLLAGAYSDTADVPEAEWLELIERVAEVRRRG